MKLRSIQVLRGVAACGVVFLHAYGTGSSVSRMGGAGVDLFFVISGFLMATIAKRPSFLFDRFWRIFPLWWVALAVWWAFNPFTNVLASIALWPISGGAMTAPDLSVGWTLSFELLFYCAVALSAHIGVKPLLALFGIMLVGAILSSAAIFDFLGNPMIFEFLFGVAIAKLPKSSRLGLPMIAVGVGLFAFAPTWVFSQELAIRAPSSAWRVLYWGIPAALAVYGCLCAEKGFERRIWTVPVLLGDASYSIYLFHPSIVANVKTPWAVEMALAISAGVLAWWIVERRIIALKPRLLGQRKLAAVVAVSEPRTREADIAASVDIEVASANPHLIQ